MLMCIINSESISRLASSVLMRDFLLFLMRSLKSVLYLLWCDFVTVDSKASQNCSLSYKLKTIIWDLINHRFSVGRRHFYKINHPVIPQRLYHQNICYGAQFLHVVCSNFRSKHNVKSGKHILLVSLDYFPAGCFTF